MAPLVPAWKRVAQNAGGVKTVVRAGVCVSGSKLPLLQVAVMTMVAKPRSLSAENSENDADQGRAGNGSWTR